MTSREILDAALAGLNDSQVFDFARNAAAPIENRKAAAEKLLAKGSHFANKAEISGLIEQLKQRSLPFEVTHESEITTTEELVSATHALFTPVSDEVDEEPKPTSALHASFTTDSIR